MNKLVRLNLAQLDEGRKKALSNSVDLVNDAKVLQRKNRWARALFLSQLAAEELGKYVIIVSAAVNLTRAEQSEANINWERFWGDFWKRYKLHHAKMSLIIHVEYFLSDSKAHEYLKKISKEAYTAEGVKMAALYSDFYDKFRSPKELITKRVSSLAVRLAERRVSWLKSYDKEVIGKNGLLRLTKMDLKQMDEKLGINDLMNRMIKSYSSS
jgi:AbiV family abortive infection protein